MTLSVDRMFWTREASGADGGGVRAAKSPGGVVNSMWVESSSDQESPP